MHMADALLSPTVGAAMWAATAGLTAYSARKVQNQLANKTIPLMGALGAFVFAAQMINFAIPGTGSSGHLGGGLLLAILLGPNGAFLTLASVLTVQALFFADGGLLALGSNIFNLGFIPCYICFPLIYKPIAGDTPDQKRIISGSILAAVAALQLGSLAVVLQTYFSGISALPLTSFLLVMQPIHLAIGLAEGAATAGIFFFIWKARPDILTITAPVGTGNSPVIKKVAMAMLAAAIFIGGVLAWFSSEHPDGLEWSVKKVAGSAELAAAGQLRNALAKVQDTTAVLPDYGFRNNDTVAVPAASRPAVNTGTSLSGIVGGLLVLSCCILLGFLLKRTNSTS